MDEFEDEVEFATHPARRHAPAEPAGAWGPKLDRLVARVYSAAPAKIRARLLECLLKRMGTLGTAGVAAGAFTSYVYREETAASDSMNVAARFSLDQVVELARFANQVSPEAVHDFAQLVIDNKGGAAAFTVAAALLLIRVVQKQDHNSRVLR